MYFIFASFVVDLWCNNAIRIVAAAAATAANIINTKTANLFANWESDRKELYLGVARGMIDDRFCAR